MLGFPFIHSKSKDCTAFEYIFCLFALNKHFRVAKYDEICKKALKHERLHCGVVVCRLEEGSPRLFHLKILDVCEPY